MSTSHHQCLSENPVFTESASVISAPQQQGDELLSERFNGQLAVTPSTSSATTTKTYPSATAKYDEVAQSSELFWEKLKAFHDSFGTKFAVPTMGGKALDLHRLFVEVTSRGGIEKVIKDRIWKEVVVVFQFPTTITSASFVLRKYYLSLIYHFEQVYYFGKKECSISTPGPLSRRLVNGSGALDEDATMNWQQGQECTMLQLGSLVSGSIDGKFDNGYLVTVNLGSDQLKGVLYHIPAHASQNNAARSRRIRKKSRLALQDPSRPKSNRSGYNFFFAEHYARLKPSYYGQERAISKKIGFLWNNLTEAEKQVYQEKGLRDKERYKTEMLEYKSSYTPTSH